MVESEVIAVRVAEASGDVSHDAMDIVRSLCTDESSMTMALLSSASHLSMSSSRASAPGPTVAAGFVFLPDTIGQRPAYLRATVHAERHSVGGLKLASEVKVWTALCWYGGAGSKQPPAPESSYAGAAGGNSMRILLPTTLTRLLKL
ncbi:hypothetical protein HBI31_241700 [Parastagonospora nodorum]|nr:hypothetical protein HBI31_241700 [Parastagonospora nodorum]